MKPLDTMLSELNEKQREAVTHEGSHALVLAGAGCGKTKTIISRASYLISKGVNPKRIMILTFTKRAANEIIERVESHLGADSEGLKASTFHSWCISIIKRRENALGIKGFTIIPPDDQTVIFKAIKETSDFELYPKVEDLKSAYSYARNTLSDPKKVIDDKFPEYYEIKDDLFYAMKFYEKKKRQMNCLDFDDILDVVANAMKLSPNICNWISGEYDHILVDEMQDTNPLQWTLLEPLSKKVKLFCVGDDAQSIYGFRGADFKNVHAFKDKLPDATIYKLEENYRSTQDILNVSNWLLTQSPIDYDKRLHAVKGSGNKPILQTFHDEFDEGQWIANDLVYRKNQGNNNWKDFMLLIRSKYSARKLEQSLLGRNIPYIVIGGKKLLEAEHIKDVLSPLRIIGNYRDELGWMRFLQLFKGIGDSTARSILLEVVTSGNLDEVIVKLTNNKKCPDEVVNIIKTLHEIEHDVPQAVSTAVALLTDVLSHKNRNKDWEKRKKDFKYLEGLANKHTSILDFISEYLLEPVTLSEVEQKQNDDVVKIITIHSAKGTECKISYVIGVSPGAYPSSRNVGSLESVEEERRVLYVALTRAMDELIITRTGSSTWAKESPVVYNSQQYDASYKLKNERGVIESYFFNNLPDDNVNERINYPQPIITGKNYYGLFPGE